MERANKGDMDGAIASWTAWLKKNPKDANAYFNRGRAKSDKGDPDAAIADYSRARSGWRRNSGRERAQNSIARFFLIDADATGLDDPELALDPFVPEGACQRADEAEQVGMGRLRRKAEDGDPRVSAREKDERI